MNLQRIDRDDSSSYSSGSTDSGGASVDRPARMSSNKRPRFDDDGAGGSSGDRQQSSSRCCPKKKHLYLVLDDWDKGYSVHKMDVDSFFFDDDDDHDQAVAAADDAAPRRLPEPPFLRLEIPDVGHLRIHTSMSVAALGTKIIALAHEHCSIVYDTETGVLGVGPHAPLQMECGCGISVPVGGALYALTYRNFDPEQPIDLAALSWARTGTNAMDRPIEGWAWKALPPPPPTFRNGVRSYALHPDGCTIFMSTIYTPPGKTLGTYSFNTKESAWRWHGGWALPFDGQGHYDAELDAWVGLVNYGDGGGHICCCQVVSPTIDHQQQTGAPTVSFPADFKTTEEKMFRKFPEERHFKASLTSMGTSRFCLVELVKPKKRRDERPFRPGDRRFVLRVTIFGLKYNHKGELQITLEMAMTSNAKQKGRHNRLSPGNTCHQCRQPTTNFLQSCKGYRKKGRKGPCTIRYCGTCLLNRYGKEEEVAPIESWICPKCRGICNCSVCRRKKEKCPTGKLKNAAKVAGCASAHDHLQNRPEVVAAALALRSSSPKTLKYISN
ncbi:hypothetical protein U9M48_030430 [Paspalum notatum var. saurae]|uniref:Zinc-finger domain-containing protein n=1 Tax=Paspalum notatum var. saurae TaxID=547442 RepID=A0AAQ3U059_PASNO